MITGVGTSSGTASSGLVAGPGGKMGKDEFLRLFIAQVKHQDPMSPLQAQEMAAQLAQFSSVEQLIQLNQHMEAQAGSDAAVVQALNAATGMSALGRTVLALGDQVAVGENGAGSVTFRVGDPGGSATLKLFDSSGKEVGTRSLGEVAPGQHTFELGEAATNLPAGSYTYKVEVTKAGESVPVETYTAALIDGIRYDSNGPVLTAGSLTIPFGSVIQILVTPQTATTTTQSS